VAADRSTLLPNKLREPTTIACFGRIFYSVPTESSPDRVAAAAIAGLFLQSAWRIIGTARRELNEVGATVE